MFYTHKHSIKLCSNTSIILLIILLCVLKVIFAPLAGLEMRVTQIFLLSFRNSFSLFDLQLDAQILIYLPIIHSLESSTCFEHCPAHLQEVYVVTVYMQPLVSSLSAGDCPVHLLRTGAPVGHLQTVTIPEAAYIQLRRRPPEDEKGNARNM